MKLSAIHGERVFDVIADIIEPIANIAGDEKASAMFRREKRSLRCSRVTKATSSRSLPPLRA